MSLSALADLWSDFARARGASERVFELMDREPIVDSGGGAGQPERGRGAGWNSRRSSFAYPVRPDVRVLDGVSLQLDPGRMVALVGPSGAGKSTVAALLLRLYDPDAGADPPRRLRSPRSRRQLVAERASAPSPRSRCSSPPRWPRTSATAGPEASDEEVEAAARAANAHEFISESAGRLRDRGRRAGRPLVGRPEAAGGHRPRHPQGPADPDPRRGHLRARRRVRVVWSRTPSNGS